jgi:hypothetical protein
MSRSTTKEKTMDRMNDSAREDGEEMEMPRDLKIQVNQLLWFCLPPSTTIGEADSIACKWVDEVRALWEIQGEKP